MNKKILAVAITGLLAASAQAASVYDADGTSIEVFGDADVRFFNDMEKDGVDNVIKIDDADFGFRTTSTMENGMTVGAEISFSGESGVDLGDAFITIGMAEMGAISFGKHATIYDDAGISSDYAFGLSSHFEQKNSGFQVVKYKIDNGGMFYGGAAYLLDTKENSDSDESGFDGKVGMRVSDFDFTLFGGSYDSGVSGVDSVTNFTLEARWAVSEDFGLAAQIGSRDDGDDSYASYAASGTYQMDKLGFAGGVGLVEQPADADDVIGYFVNVDYMLSSYATAYVEVGGNDADDSELGYTAGVAVAF